LTAALTERLYTRAEVERMLARTQDMDWTTSSRLGPVVLEYLAWKRLGAAPRTLDTYERRLAVLCYACPAATIKSLDVGDLMIALTRVPPRSQRVTIAAWNGMIEWAILHDRRTAKNPVKLLPRLRKHTPPAIRLFDDPERARLIAAAALGFDPPRDRVRAYLLLDGGFRKSECIQLRNRDVDPMRREVIVTGKGDKERVVPIATEDFWIAWLDHVASRTRRWRRRRARTIMCGSRCGSLELMAPV
jgi:site-specific recombinase XerC